MREGGGGGSEIVYPPHVCCYRSAPEHLSRVTLSQADIIRTAMGKGWAGKGGIWKFY